MLFGFDASQIIVLITLASGILAQYMNYRQTKRNSLKEDYDRQHKELEDERARNESLRKYRDDAEEWKLKAALAESKLREANIEIERLKIQVAKGEKT